MTVEVPATTVGKARALPLRLSERKLLLFLVDLIIVNVALTASLAGRFREPFGWHLVQRNPAWYLILTGTWVALSFLLDAYDLRRAARPGSGVSMGAAAALATVLVYLAIPRLTPPLPTSRTALFLFVGLMVGTVAAWRGGYALLLVGPSFRRKALIVGAGWAGKTVAAVAREHAASEYDLVGFVDDDPQKQRLAINGLTVLGTRDDLGRLIGQTGASEIIVAITQPDRMHPEMFQIIMDCHERGIQITQMPALFEQLTGRVPVEHAGRNLYVVLPLNGYPSQVQQVLKRLFDLVVGVVGFALTALVLPFVWLALRLDGMGPVFYRQARVGRGGELFDLIKFRTMVPDAEVNGPQWANENDRRVTSVGRILRRLHIDEIPQAINILRGELSFIGPRPERPEFMTQLEKQIPFYRARHAVRPGITGWAQVNYRYGASVEEALIKLQYDLYYIKHQSLWLDFLILIKTMPTVLTLRGR